MFHKCKTQKEAKQLFRKLSKKLHPDLGGSAELMILLQEAYDRFTPMTNSSNFKFEGNYGPKNDPKVNRIFPPDPRLETLYELEEIYSDDPSLYSTFFESVLRFFKTKGYVTVKQLESLEDLYNKWGKSS